MPLYEVVLNQRYANQQCVNRWNYLGSGTPAAVSGSFALLSAMGFLSVTTSLDPDTVGGKLQALQNVDTVFLQVLARAVYVDDDFYDEPFITNTLGTWSGGGQSASPLLAFGFRTNRVRQSINRGTKRFVGVSESHMDVGGQWSSATVTAMSALSDKMDDTLTYDDEGNTLTFVPVVVSKEKYTTERGNTAYKYYSTELLQAAHLAEGITWSAYNEVRSQTSRQYGRGI